MAHSASLSSRCLAVVLSASILAPATFYAPVAFAQPAAAPAKRKPMVEQLPPAAVAPWKAGVDFYNHGDNDAARASFQAAYDISKNPRVLFNVAVCEKNLRHYARALELYKRELEEGKTLLQPDEIAEVQAQISGLEQYVAPLTINVNENGAQVFVDDVLVGTSPLPGPVTVERTSHKLRATKAGFSDALIELKDVGTGAAQLTLQAFIRTNVVNVNVIGPPPGRATVKIDGKEVGPAPYHGAVSVSVEPHVFSAEAPGWVSASNPQIVKEGDPITINLHLDEEAKTGRLLVIAQPPESIIELDGKVVGATQYDGPVAAGQHQVSAKKEGYYTYSTDVLVPQGASRTVNIQLNENRQASFVPWMIGTLLVVGTSAVAIYFITRAKDQDPTQGTFSPGTVETHGLHGIRW